MSGTKKLMSVIESRNIGKLSELLEKMDLDEVNGKQDGETALHYACRKGYNETVDLLVAKNCIDVNVKDSRGMTPLHVAVCSNNAYAVAKILTNPQVDVNVQDKDGWTPLHVASVYCKNAKLFAFIRLYNYHQIVSELLASPGIDVNVQTSRGGRTPLHNACVNNQHQMVEELLDVPGVDVNVRDRDGFTPVMSSARRCHQEALKLMLEDNRVDLDAKDEDGRVLEAQVERDWRNSKRKEKCLEMIYNERRKRENSKLEQEQPSQDGNIGQRVEKVEKLNQEIGDLEKKWKAHLDIGKQKKKDLNERQNAEKKTMAQRHKEDEAAVKKKHEEEETTMNRRHKDQETMLETTLARENQVEQRHMAILRECRDELAQDLQKLTIDPAHDTSGDRVKLEAARRSLECPVCMDLMRPPTRIWMCRLSHIICEPCKDELDKKEKNRGMCPTCMTERVNLRALMAENFARTIFNE